MRKLLSAVHVAAVSGLLAGMSACGGSDKPSLEQYFRQLQAAGEGGGQRAAALQDEYEVRIASEQTAEGILEATRQLYSGKASVFAERMDKLKDVEPPAEAEKEHEEFVEATRVSAAVYENLSERAARAQSMPELQQLVAELDRRTVEAVFEHFEDTCRVLQGIADENSIDVALDCEA